MNEPIKGFMLDTQIFDRVLDGDIDLGLLLFFDVPLYVTHVQYDEIMCCPDELRRNELIKIFLSINKKDIPTASMVCGVSRCGGCCVSDGKLLKKLSNGNPKNTEDALIGETCIVHGLTLVTDDVSFAKIMHRYGGKTINIKKPG